MGEIKWIYDRQDHGEQGINNSGIATFSGSELFGYLARENGQNSLDAYDPEKKTVILSFKSVSLPIKDYPELLGLRETIDECQAYWKDRGDVKCNRFFSEAKRKISDDYVDLLIISDYNTLGASGANAPKRHKSKWRALTSSDGVTDNNQGSGGAYGIGKNAPFACSCFRTVFYNTYSKTDQVKAFQGTSKLVTHIHNDTYLQGLGFCLNQDPDSLEDGPVLSSGISPLMDFLNRTEYGTDVIVAGFRKTSDWEQVIERAVLKNFFIAIAKGKLVVRIGDNEINESNIKSRLEYYAEEEKDLPQKYRIITPNLEYYSAYKEPDYVITGNIMNEGDAILYIKKDDSYSKSIAEMRAIGMVVRTRTKNIYSRYAAVLTVEPGPLNNLLKEIEPPTHDKWDPGILSDDEEERKRAEKVRNKLINWVNGEIVNNCKGELLDEFDLDGVSAYLPYDDDDTDLGEPVESNEDSKSTHNDGDQISLDSDLLTGDIKKTKPNVRKVSVVAKKVKGYKDDTIDPHNSTNGGKGKGKGGREDENGPDDVTAIKEGPKSANVPKIARQRIVSTMQEGRYMALFELENDCSSVHIGIKALGDDNRKETINIQSFRMEGVSQEQSVNSSVIELRNLKKNKLYKLFLSLTYTERLTLELNIG